MRARSVVMPGVTSELDTLAEAEPLDVAAWERVVVEAISGAESYSDLEALCGAESVEDAFLGEGDAPASSAIALVELALRLGQGQGAKVIAFTVRSAGIDVTTSLAPELPAAKPQFTSGLESVLPRIREVLAGPDSELAPGLLALLLRCPTLEQDVALAVPLLTRKGLAPTALLVGAVLARRHGLAPEDPRRQALLARARKETRAVPAKHTASSDLTVACAAAAALALQDASSAVFAAAEFSLSARAPLPEAWGWSLGTRTLTCADLVAAMLRHADTATLEPASLARVLRSMGGLPPAPPKTEPVEDLATLIISLGLRGTRTPPPLGLVAAELDEVSHAALEALATARFERAFVAIRSVGFWSHGSIRALLSGEGPHYRLVDIGDHAGSSRLHALRVWRGAAAGEITHEAALGALKMGASPGEIADLLFLRTDRPITEAMLASSQDWEREQGLALALIEWLEGRHLDWKTELQQRSSGPPVIAPFVTLALLRAASRGELVIEERHHRVIQSGFLAGKVLEPTLGLVRGLPTATAAALLDKAGGIFKNAGA